MRTVRDQKDRQTHFQPIAAYGLLSDCNSAALIDRCGSIDWLCLPRFDSGALCARLLDPAAGHWQICPVDRFHVTRRYLPGTLVHETLFMTDSGTVRLVDAMAFAQGERVHDLGRNAPHEVLRLVEGVRGAVELTMEFAPRPWFGLAVTRIESTASGCRVTTDVGQFALTAPAPVATTGDACTTKVWVTAGDRVGFSLRWGAAYGRSPKPTPPNRVPGRIDDVVAAWRSWEDAHDIYRGERRADVRLSARVLKALAYRPTGAIIAAPTTSLPEEVGGERNWDYRYAWVRDASLTLEALYIGACPEEAGQFLSFLTKAAGSDDDIDRSVQVMYGVGGERNLTERTLSHLTGWRGSRPVRVGNGAWDQTQLDVYGELLIAIHLYRDHLGDLVPSIRSFVAQLAGTAARRWTEPDSGLWEMRGEPRHHLSSKVLCWAALDRAVRLGARLGLEGLADGWAIERDRIRAAILTRGWSERRGAFAQAFDSDELDAAALLMPLVGFLPATEPRMRATIEAIARDLTEHGCVLRYLVAPGPNPDGLTGEEGTFLLCSYWLVACLALAGERERAAALYDRLNDYGNDLGLLSEEIAPRTGELLGNFPQAFSHLGQIIAAAYLDGALRGEEGLQNLPVLVPERHKTPIWRRWLGYG
jgi:GH15 family glucan-1,4-alpha-glucosidase